MQNSKFKIQNEAKIANLRIDNFQIDLLNLDLAVKVHLATIFANSFDSE